MYKYCLERRNSKNLIVQSAEVGTLSEPEWIFVFERVGALGSEKKGEENQSGRIVYSLDEVLDLRYIICLAHVALNL